MLDSYITKEQRIAIIDAHLRDLHAEKYSHELRIIEFNAAGLENIDEELYLQISNMIPQYDDRIQALKDERVRVELLPE
jgi:hypothetical protein